VFLLGSFPGFLPAQQNVTQTGVPVIRIDSVEVIGFYRYARPTILGTLGIQAGAEVTYRDIQKGIKNLYATGGFSDVIVRAEGSPEESVTLFVEVRERELIRRVVISGLEHADEGTVRDTTGLQSNQPYSPRKILAAAEFIRAELAREGIPFARIDDSLREVPDRPGEFDLLINVAEGNRVTIADLAISGNEFLSDEEIAGAMETKVEGFLWFRGGSYDESAYQRDLAEAIPRLYTSLGFLDFQLLSDSLVVDPQTGKARVDLELVEGDRYRLDDFVIDGNRHFTTEQLEAYFRTEEGGLLSRLGVGGGGETGEDPRPYFNAMAFEDARAQAQQAYANEGYIYAQIQPWIEPLDVEEGEVPSVRVGWDIEELTPAYINRITITGNDHTHDRVIREQLLILPGDVYSMDRILSSYQGISALGFFETPLPEPQIVPDEETRDVDITFIVQERSTGAINFGTAVGGGTGVSGFLGYDQPNLFGQAKSGHLRWDFGRYINSLTLSFSDPALFQSRVSGTISFFNSRDRFFQFATGRRKRLGFSTRFGFPIPWSRRAQVFVGYSLARTKYELFQDVDDTSLFGLPPGTQSTLTLGVVRSQLNHPLFPTMGSRQSWSTELNGGILGGDGAFVKHMAEGSWYLPAGQFGGGAGGGRPIRTTLGLHLKAGAVFGDVRQFPFDRFWMGGVQFGEQLRGYDETSITPLGYFPERSRDIADISRLGNAFLLMTAEYAIRVNDNLSLSTFYEAGNIWADPRSVDPTRLFRSAGIGVSLVTPFGPIGLDYAYGFDKTRPGWQLHFKMGAGF
jgi:outer membrane protein insertion porin family